MKLGSFIMDQWKKIAAIVLALSFADSAMAKMVHYELTATKGVVNLSGKSPVNWH